MSEKDKSNGIKDRMLCEPRPVTKTASRAGFFNLGTFDILGCIILCWGKAVLYIVECLAASLASTH